MNLLQFQDLARALSTDQGRQILEKLADNGWYLASEIAREMDIHISTASKYLAILERSGVVEARDRPTARGSAVEYKLRSPVLQIVVDLRGARAEESSATEFALALIEKMATGAEKLGFRDVWTRMVSHLQVFLSKLSLDDDTIVRDKTGFKDMERVILEELNRAGSRDESEILGWVPIFRSIQGELAERLSPKIAHHLIDQAYRELEEAGFEVPHGLDLRQVPRR